MKPLTDLQKKVLTQVRDGGVGYQARGCGAYRIEGTDHPSVVGRLKNMGLVRLPFPGRASLTDAGRAALS